MKINQGENAELNNSPNERTTLSSWGNFAFEYGQGLQQSLKARLLHTLSFQQIRVGLQEKHLMLA